MTTTDNDAADSIASDPLVVGYRAHFEAQSEETSWAWEAVYDLCGDLDKGIDISLRLIDSADDDFYLAYIAAGPVEDILRWHGPAAVRRFEEVADRDEKVRSALDGVWLGKTDAAHTELERVLAKWRSGGDSGAGPGNRENSVSGSKR